MPSGSKGGLLTAVFGYQHAAEKARFEVNDVPGPPEPGDDIPIAARAAHKSRLVFKVPKGDGLRSPSMASSLRCRGWKWP